MEFDKYIDARNKALGIINNYPKTNIGNHFLTIKNGKKVFFNIFIKKYGLSGANCKYSNLDIYRRIKIIECFEFLLQKYDISSEDQNTIIIETIFFRFIVKKYFFRKGSMRYELLSFYNK